VQIFKKSFDTEALFGALKKFCAFEVHNGKILSDHSAGGGA
jgi:hypothetical protein